MDALEILRIEAGQPRYGVDMDETNIVTEAGLDESVSYTKGCYVGQEIIARIHWRGHVAKKLAGLLFMDEGEVERGAKITAADGKEIGRVTSATFSPRLARTVALAYVKYDYLAPGTQARVVAGNSEREAEVAQLPLVRGSWFESDETAEPGT
jgi:folate-binding protein YgfZ